MFIYKFRMAIEVIQLIHHSVPFQSLEQNLILLAASGEILGNPTMPQLRGRRNITGFQPLSYAGRKELRTTLEEPPNLSFTLAQGENTEEPKSNHHFYTSWQ